MACLLCEDGFVPDEKQMNCVCPSGTVLDEQGLSCIAVESEETI